MLSENDLKIGDVFGGFRLEKELGRGGMGVVFKAHELSLNRKIALKVLASRLSSNDEFVQRFRREAQIVAAMKHPNIVSVLSYAEEQGLHYFAMEYVEGRDLGRILKEKGVLPFGEALGITRQVADALAEAGKKGVVHRDIKPPNIMIDGKGCAYVTDFGVAHFADSSQKLTQTGLFLGTPEYASPEQATGKSLDIRSDIYSLGAVLYRMISGRVPIEGDSPLAVVVKISTETVTPISEINPLVPKSICDLLEKMMAKDISERYQTPEVLIADLDNCIHMLPSNENNGGSDLHDEDAKTYLIPPKRRPKIGFVGGVLGVALSVLLIVWLVEGGWRDDAGDVDLFEENIEANNENAVSGSESSFNIPPPSVSNEVVESREGLSSHIPASVSNNEIAGGGDFNENATGADASSVPETILTQSPVADRNNNAGMLSTEGKNVEDIVPSSVQLAAIPKADKPLALPKTPTVLTIVSGDESMLPSTRSHLYSAMRSFGLKVISFAEIPLLREKMQYGGTRVSWYDVRQVAPPEKAQILVLAEIIRTGSMPIRYMGTSDVLTSASFSLHAIDMDSGASIFSSTSDVIQFTALNMSKKLQEEIENTSDGIETEIQQYWRNKRASRKASDS